MTDRHVDNGSTVYSFANCFLVTCPRCSKCARTSPHLCRNGKTIARLICTSCGYTKDRAEKYADRKNKHTDWYFDLPLWLTHSCCGDTLWAHNLEHLDYISSYVTASHRMRNPDSNIGIKNATMASRFPKWLTSAKNRDEVIRCVEILRSKIVG